MSYLAPWKVLDNSTKNKLYKFISTIILTQNSRDVKGEFMEDYFMENDEGNIFELINEECYYDDIWREENGID